MISSQIKVNMIDLPEFHIAKTESKPIALFSWLKPRCNINRPFAINSSNDIVPDSCDYETSENAIQPIQHFVVPPDQQSYEVTLQNLSTECSMNSIQPCHVECKSEYESTLPVIKRIPANSSLSMMRRCKEFQNQFPVVYCAFKKGLLNIENLLAHEIVIAIKEEITLHKESARTSQNLKGEISKAISECIRGRLPDPTVMGTKLIDRLTHYIYFLVENRIKSAEDDRSIAQWALRRDVQTPIDFRYSTTNLDSNSNLAIVTLDGCGHIYRRKGEFFSIISPDLIYFDLDVVMRLLYFNGPTLLDMENDKNLQLKAKSKDNLFVKIFYQ